MQIMADKNTTPKGNESNPKNPIDGGKANGGEPKNGEDNNPSGNDPKNGNEADKSFSQEDLNKVVSTRVSEVTDKLEKKFNDKLRKEREDWERQSKLSEEEKEKEIRQREEEKRLAKDKELTLRENRLVGREKLVELDMPTEFVDFVLTEDVDDMSEKITTLHEQWQSAVEAKVKEQLAGKTPKDPSGKSSSEDEKPRSFTF